VAVVDGVGRANLGAYGAEKTRAKVDAWRGSEFDGIGGAILGTGAATLQAATGLQDGSAAQAVGEQGHIFREAVGLKTLVDSG